jgi:hypothetical protein
MGHVTPESQFKFQTISRLGGVPTDFDPQRVFEGTIQRTPRWNLWQGAGVELALPDADYGQLLLSLATSHARSCERPQSASLWIDHTPNNIRHAHTLDTLIPGSRFIHIVRDGRAVCASQMPLVWGAHTPLKAAAFWKGRVAEGLGVELDRKLKDRVLRVHYEELLQAPERVLRAVCSFAGIDFVPSMLEGGTFPTPSFTSDQHALVNSAPDPSRIEGWRDSLDAQDIRAIEWSAGSLLQSLGYECDYWPQVEPVSKRARLAYILREYGPYAFLARRAQRRRERAIRAS